MTLLPACFPIEKHSPHTFPIDVYIPCTFMDCVDNRWIMCEVKKETEIESGNLEIKSQVLPCVQKKMHFIRIYGKNKIWQLLAFYVELFSLLKHR